MYLVVSPDGAHEKDADLTGMPMLPLAGDRIWTPSEEEGGDAIIGGGASGVDGAAGIGGGGGGGILVSI